jgi:exodeoxyribonuclease VII large subunit
VAVQGDTAAKQIAHALDKVNEYGRVDCIIVGRGGGSIEDLWAFNEEIVARAIFASKIPVITAVGHEIDFTIADFVADVRAATPSAAAEIAVSDTNEERRLLDITTRRYVSALSRYFSSMQQQYHRLHDHHLLRRPWRLYLELQQHYDDLKYRSETALLRLLQHRYLSLSSAGKQLSALNPLSVLSRGYSVASKEDGTIIKTTEQITTGERITIRFQKGSAKSRIESLFSEEISNDP